MGNNAPDGYLKCDGKEYKINDYKNLAEQIKNEFGSYNYFGGDGIKTFSVPDLQGEFLRGTGTNSHENQGSGENVGIHQDATAIPYFGSNTYFDLYYTYDTEINNADKLFGNMHYTWNYDNDSNTGRNIYQYFTSRPTNTSVLYCIKY